MHPSAHLHRMIARDTEARRMAEAAAARDASIGAARRRQLSSPRETPAQGLLTRLLPASLRSGS